METLGVVLTTPLRDTSHNRGSSYADMPLGAASTQEVERVGW